ncbi:MAG: serine hydrolase domain-containing protein [Bacteroidota bacterium]|nr:serine hydrolase domain-containing protein [Bacteroidota bacterium]
MKYKILFLLLFFGIMTTACLSQIENAKKVIEAYVDAFNSGEAAMRNFLTDNISNASLEQRPVEVRLSIYKQMRDNMVKLTLHEIRETTKTAITAFMHTKKDEWFLFTFELEQQSPNKIIGIRIENIDEPESTTAPKVKEIVALQSVTQFLDEKTKKDEFSGTVLIAKNGKAIFKRAFGMAIKEFKFKNTPDTKFNLGSINKIFTQIAIGQLYEDGKLSFSDPIIKYLPDYPNKTAAEKVTIRHMLDMSSGVGDFFGEKFDNTPKDKFRTISDFLPMFASDSLRFEPGSQKQYSNGGFIVLGAIIEKASGQSYYDYVKEHIFKPAGMSNTDSYEADIPVSNLAEGYTREETDKPWRKNIYTRPARGSSAGGGYSTAEDLLKFTIALEKKTFFQNPDTWNLLRGEPSGQIAGQQDGIGIFGGAPGINAGVETKIGKGYTAIVMSNYDPPTAVNVMKKIRGILKNIR